MSDASIVLGSRVTDPSPPSSGRGIIYLIAETLFFRDDAGVITQLAGGIRRVSVADIGDPSPELSLLQGASSADLLIAYQVVAGGEDATTIYSWDVSPGGVENVPFTVDGTGGGRWDAWGGRYVSQIIESAADENKIRFNFATFASLPNAGEFDGMFAHVDDMADLQLGHAAYFADGALWRLLKDHSRDDEATLAPGAVVDIAFGQGSVTYQTLTLDQDTTLTTSSPSAGTMRLLRVTSGTPGQTLTLPVSFDVFGVYDSTGVDNLLWIECVSPTVAEIQLGSPPAGAFIATFVGNPGNQKQVNLNSTTGFTGLAAGLITIKSTTTIDVAAGEGTIVNLDDPTNPTTVDLQWAAFADVPINVTQALSTIYIIDTGGGVAGLLVENTQDNGVTRRTRIRLGLALHSAGVITSVLLNPITTYGVGSALVDLYRQLGDINRTGNEYSADGANLRLQRSGGEVFGRNLSIAPTPNDPNIATLAAVVAISSYVYSRRDGSGGFPLSVTAQIDPDNYDAGTAVLTPMPAGKFQAQRLLFDARSGRTVIEYGQNVYDSIDKAVDGINQNNIAPNLLFNTLLLTGWLVVRQGATDLTVGADAFFAHVLTESTSPSGNVGDVDGPASSVAGNLASFADATGKIIDDAGPAIADVVLVSNPRLPTAGATIGDLLYWDGSGWAILAPGVANQRLRTAGPGLPPFWGT